MKLRFVVLVLVLATLAAPAVAAAAADPCAFPTTAASSPEETAWQLFVAANCAAQGQLTWETWEEQTQVYPASGVATTAAAAGGARRLHGSPLAQALAARKAGKTVELNPQADCNKMQAPPPGLAATIVCEEVHINVPAVNFLTSNSYQIRSGQTKAAQAGTDIQFPPPAVEVKVDWIPASDFKKPFTCANPPKGVHVREFDGTCYAMAGMHIASKLATDWIWATFEPQYLQTNPNRCITFGPCHDRWGSKPAVSNGGAKGFTQQTPALKALMTQANLAPELFNYRLDGVQTVFGTAKNPTLLGNSIIEGENVGMTKGTASCITCHSISSVSTDGTDGAKFLGDPKVNQVGPEFKPPKGWIARDFVWSMGLACPGASFQTCTSSSGSGGGQQ